MGYLYCCVCERETLHEEVDDDKFYDFALECMTCHVLWEAEIQFDGSLTIN